MTESEVDEERLELQEAFSSVEIYNKYFRESVLGRYFITWYTPTFGWYISGDTNLSKFCCPFAHNSQLHAVSTKIRVAHVETRRLLSRFVSADENSAEF